MSRLRIFYIASMVLLGVLIAFVIFRPMAAGEEYSEVSREHLLHKDSMYVVEFDIVNQEGEPRSYTINVVIDDYQYSEEILIPDGGVYTYMHDVYPDRLTEGNISFAIYKEGESTPFEEITYYLR